MNNNKKLKAILLSLGLAALMAPATMNAQINRGLLQNPYKDESGKNHGMMNPAGSRGNVDISEGNDGFTNQGYGEPAPLGSGIAVLLLAGVGYVALKKKED